MQKKFLNFRKIYQDFCNRILFFDSTGMEFTGKDIVRIVFVICIIISCVFLTRYVDLHWREGYFDYLVKEAWWLLP